MTLLLSLLACAPKTSVDAAQVPPSLNPTLVAQLEVWEGGAPETLSPERQAALGDLAAWIHDKQAAGEPAHLTFVCTHNSRRSHMAQLWAQAAAHHHGLDQVQAWSGGTEATAFNPRAVTALTGHGMDIAPTGEVLGEENTVYQTRLGEGLPALRSFSKTFADPFNPQQGFAAVMVCSSADAACPYVEGAETRISVPYLDPKTSDGTPEEAATYAAKSLEIGVEMAWLMAQASQ